MTMNVDKHDIVMSATQDKAWVPGAGMRWCANPIVEWLLTEALAVTSTLDLLEGLCRRLLISGTPLSRMYCLVRTLHPQVAATSYTWRRDTGVVEKVLAPHGAFEGRMHLESPCAAIFEGAVAIRRRLDIPRPRLDFPILRDLWVENATDYVAMPMRFSDGQINVFSVATDWAGGFSYEDLERIHDVLPILGLRVEVQEMRRTAETLLETYLGKHSGAQVLRGLIKRGDGEDVHAVIWFCDLRGSTALAESMPRRYYLGLLNDFFDCIAGAVLDHGGEVLRFIGDAVLAIFPTGETPAAGSRKALGIVPACRAALAAALDASEGMKVLNATRARKGRTPLAFGLALHVGEVTCGNIGVPERLDFTVIGPAANEAARMQDLSKTVGRPILMSDEFVRRCPGEFVSLGTHQLRGIDHPRQIYTLPAVGEAGTDQRKAGT